MKKVLKRILIIIIALIYTLPFVKAEEHYKINIPVEGYPVLSHINDDHELLVFYMVEENKTYKMVLLGDNGVEKEVLLEHFNNYLDKDNIYINPIHEI